MVINKPTAETCNVLISHTSFDPRRTDREDAPSVAADFW
jgi:hypothetical protein